MIHVQRPGDWSPTIGNFLGDMTDELEKPYGAGSYITEFVSGGPKNYAYKVYSTRKETVTVGDCKVRGITLDHNAIRSVNFETMKNMMNHVDQGTGRAWEADDEELIVPVHYSHCIRRNGPGKVLTKAIVKDYRLGLRQTHHSTRSHDSPLWILKKSATTFTLTSSLLYSDWSKST